MLEEERELSKDDAMHFIGHIAPNVPNQRIRLDLKDPANRLRIALAKTDASGVFRAGFDLTQPNPGAGKKGTKEKPLPGQYLCVASVLDSPDVAEATSNTVVVMR